MSVSPNSKLCASWAAWRRWMVDTELALRTSAFATTLVMLAFVGKVMDTLALETE